MANFPLVYFSVGVLALFPGVMPSVCFGQVAADSPRLSPLVKVIRNMESSAVALFVPTKGGLVSGTGTLIHPSGFVLTNNHVLPTNEGLALIGTDLPEHQKPEPFRVVGRLPEKDLAIVKLRSHGPFPAVPLGRSHDVMNGETVVVAGNPGGRGLVFTSGIISAKSVLSGAPNALVMTNYRDSRRDTYIQFDAASNGGNSGGGLINMDGQLIGVVWGGIRQEQNVGYAIPVDVVHQLIDEILEPEIRSGKWLGLQLKQDEFSAVVSHVVADSPAMEAGILSGDQLLAVNGQTLRHRVDWFLELSRLLAAGRPFGISLKRNEQAIDLTIRPIALKPEAASVDVNESELKPGLKFDFYHGHYSLVPNFDNVKPERSGVVATVDLNTMRQDRKDELAIRLQGYLKVPQDAVYRLIIQSDDGSKVSLNGRLVIDHDGNHHSLPRGKMLYLAKGLHALQIEYFEGNGAEDLQLLIESPAIRESLEKPITVPADMLWHREQAFEK
ncbi:MAG: trypsin-like peptidase domain-containing protein [Planctomycetaceae bacterium]|nr:trypsin-like peptidase domain-containing protein [Planctomycetaceae bacterium]